VALTPVKRENSLYRSDLADDDQQTRAANNNNNHLLLHQNPAAITANNIAADTMFHNVHGLPAQAVSSSTASAAVGGVGDNKLMSGASAGGAPASVDIKHGGGQQCVYCAAAFKSKGELERHVKTTHVIPSTSQKCNICDEVFPSASVLAEHKLTHCKVY